MGRRRFAHDGIDSAKMARTCFRIFARRLRAWVLAGSGGVRLHLSALGMAPALFCWRISGAAYAFCSRESQGAGGLASFTHGLDELSPGDFWKSAALCLPGPSDGHGEFQD